jgi:hypothetical protein
MTRRRGDAETRGKGTRTEARQEVKEQKLIAES